MGETVSVDDGYACKGERDELLALGIEVVSINGSKGKRLIGLVDWDTALYREARRLRGSAESPIFVLKHGFQFGQLRRCGVEAEIGLYPCRNARAAPPGSPESPFPLRRLSIRTRTDRPSRGAKGFSNGL